MVGRIPLCLLLCILPLTVMAADEARVWLELDNNRVELGKPLHATLHSRGINKPLTLRDLEPLRQAFALTDSSEVEKQGREVRLAFTLYPRRSGTIQIPSLEIAGHRSKPHVLEVLPAASRGIPIKVTPSISTSRPWVRQQVLVTLEVTTPDRFATLEVEVPRLPDFEVMAIPGERAWIDTAAGKHSRLRAGFALFPLTSGQQTLRLPPIRYRLAGGTRRLFALPVTNLTVRALPPYVPPTLPVGKVEIEAKLQNGEWLYPNGLAFWHIGLSAEAVPPQWLPPLQKVLTVTNDIRIMPAAANRTASPNPEGVNARNIYRIPFAPQSQGRIELPSLSVDYFDPESGKLARAVYHPPHLWVLGYPLRLFLLGLLLVVFALAGKRALQFVVGEWRRYRNRHAAIMALEHANDAAAIRTALRHYASADGASANLSLKGIQQMIGSYLPGDELNELSAASYSGTQNVDLELLRQRLISQLKSRRAVTV